MFHLYMYTCCENYKWNSPFTQQFRFHFEVLKFLKNTLRLARDLYCDIEHLKYSSLPGVETDP